MADVGDRIRQFWDEDAVTYDATKSHAVSDPLERAAWRQALVEALPEPGAKVLDVGAGTGALSLLAAELGFEVTASSSQNCRMRSPTSAISASHR